ncbi:MAG: hypothetical protein R6V04_08580 [bacterium]
MFDDLVYDFVVFNKGDNSHGSSALGTDERIDTVHIESCMTPVKNLLEGSQIGSHIPEEMAQNNGRAHCKKRCAPDDVGGRPCSWQG